MAATRIRVASEKRCTGPNRSPRPTPNAWITAFVPLTAAATSLLLSASPRTFSSLGSEMLMSAADRAKARTVCPASSAWRVVSSPMPFLAPMITTRAMPMLRDRAPEVVQGACGQHLCGLCAQQTYSRLSSSVHAEGTRSTLVKSI